MSLISAFYMLTSSYSNAYHSLLLSLLTNEHVLYFINLLTSAGAELNCMFIYLRYSTGK